MRERCSGQRVEDQTIHITNVKPALCNLALKMPDFTLLHFQELSLSILSFSPETFPHPAARQYVIKGTRPQETGTPLQ